MTKDQKEVLVAITEYVLELIEKRDGASSGEVYARLQGLFGAKYSLDIHTGVIVGLEKAGKITNKNYWLEVV